MRKQLLTLVWALMIVLFAKNANATWSGDDHFITQMNTPINVNIGLNDDTSSAAACSIWSSNGANITAEGGALVNLAPWEFQYTPPTGFVGLDSIFYEYCYGDSINGFFVIDTVLVLFAVQGNSGCSNPLTIDVIDYNPYHTPYGGDITLGLTGGAPGYVVFVEDCNGFQQGNQSVTSANDTVYIQYLGPGCNEYHIYDSNGCLNLFTHILPHDSVFPGDCNVDKVANVFDLLNIGVAYGESSYQNWPRPNASLNWVGQYSQSGIWNQNGPFANGYSKKHGDCDGNGTINVLDAQAILLNYGKTWFKGDAPAFHQNAVNLILEASPDTVDTNSWVNIKVKLGESVLPADSVYGIAFSLSYDPALVDSSSVAVSYGNSWLGNISNANDMIALDKNLYQDGQLDIALTRTDKVNKSGFGEIAEIDIFTTDDIAGKTNIYESLKFTITNVKLIRADESVVDVNVVSDSVTVSQEGAPLSLSSNVEALFKVFPNPTSGVLNIASQETFSWSLMDLNGKVVKRSEYMNQGVCNLEEVDAGLYFLEISSGSNTLHHRVVKR
ncbi:MAG: T9SS type A sorting domain-containing protein [Flavobacteriales bacterium]|nr:T9SS type A sorting domain-containing protein [Flavobacteriales bacterium]